MDRSAGSPDRGLGRTVLLPGLTLNAIGLTELVQAYLDAQYLSLTAGERALRARHLEVVHPTRVASRRYRTVLRDLKNLFNPEVAMVLEESLRWYAGVLGGVRDLQVGRVELSRLLDKLPDNGQARQARHVVEEYLSHRERAAAVALQIALDSHRYQRMIDQLSIWHEDQPVSTDRDDADIKGYLNRARRRVRRRLEEAADAGQPEELLHDARKAAKRARYIAELAEPSLGGQGQGRRPTNDQSPGHPGSSSGRGRRAGTPPRPCAPVRQ